MSDLTGLTEQETIKELEAEFPAWQVWTVHRYIGGTVWCARLWDDHRTVKNADSPEHLREYITEHETA